MNTFTPGMESLSGLDGAFLNLETLATPMHVGSLHTFEVPAGYQGDFLTDAKTMLAQRMVPLLRRHLTNMPLQLANPMWVQGEVDLDWHIERIMIAAPGERAQLEAVVAGLHADLLERARPLWKMYVLDGLSSGEKAYYFKIHHAMLDGHAAAALAAALFDTAPVVFKTSARKKTVPARPYPKPPGALRLVAAALRRDARQYVKLVRVLPGVARTLAGLARSSGGAPDHGTVKPGSGKAAKAVTGMAFAPRTPLNVAITRERGFAAEAVPLAEVKAIAGACDATVNDVVLTVCGGALRRYLARLGPLPQKSLIATMAISLRDKGNTDFHTQAMLSLVSLATRIKDPLKRLQAVHGHTTATKAVARHAKSALPTDFPCIGAPWLISTLANLYGRAGVSEVLPLLANLVISNVPGPPVPLYVGQARMTGYWPVSIVEHGVGLNITLMSYAGQLCVGFTVARCAVPDVRQLADDFVLAYVELKHAPLANCSITHLPGPTVALYLLGAQLTYLSAIMPTADGMGLVFSVTSYNDMLVISLTGCDEQLPEPEVFAQCLCDSFQEYRALLPAPATAARATRKTAQPTQTT
ncbi:wax ester/triacylglycerol synthase family O-acyltransferase [Rhodoferax antarcticus]|uniref:wax ester/triacylglycerol synthase family O-acyltransferase n=1 Tax=Rhodoferax antarcticus TaxID=81479 RepID=UPI0022242FB3|nr:wax ester/triacylglycerol synthase family O-acyltransferase [Rhodoferax antarcticus]MCW2312543.1 WS/DGAT/MGAT family acyltransferase [Rhodoferax antarcticus]